MRRLAIMISIIGAVAFVALLAWGLAFGNGTARADDATATPTATPAATATVSPCLLVAPGAPALFEGLVTISGQPAPAGTELTLTSDSVTWGTATVAAATAGPFAGSANYYNVTISFMPRLEPPCQPPATLTVSCDATGGTDATFENVYGGAMGTQNIDCVGGTPPATATPTPAATATPAATGTPAPTASATPTPTPGVLPPTGMGGMSGDGGFMWWPLALAAAALTSVVGLFTARWARR
jgi:chitinase